MKLKPLFLMLGAAALFAGCGSDGANEFAGDYAGVAMDDTYYYALEATVADDGTITGTLHAYDGSAALPFHADFPGDDFGQLLDFTGTVDGTAVTASTDGGEFTITGSFDESTGIFQGEIEEDGADSSDLNVVAAWPMLEGQDVAVSCGIFQFYEITAATAAKDVPTVSGYAMFLSDGTDVVGVMADADNDPSGLFEGTIGEENLCPAGPGFCDSFTGEFDLSWDAESVTLELDGSAEVDFPEDGLYGDFGSYSEIVTPGYEGSLLTSTEDCYHWDI